LSHYDIAYISNLFGCVPLLGTFKKYFNQNMLMPVKEKCPVEII